VRPSQLWCVVNFDAMMSQAAANATWEKVLGVCVVDAFIGKTYQRQPNVAKAQQPLKIEGATLHVCEDA
jgi:hypothetical protein